jgi:Protein of unknown function (DUF3995)
MFAWIAAALGVAYALISAYWALGGTGLLSTVGGSIEHDARTGGLLVTAGLWVVVLVKLVAAALPVFVVRSFGRPRRERVARRLVVFEAVVLTLYGFALTATGVLVQLGVISRGAHADNRALAWHAFLWDPWFLIWGLAVLASLRLRRASARAPSAAVRGASTRI